MNILLINGSPKGERSNTLRLADAFWRESAVHSKTACLKSKGLILSRWISTPALGAFPVGKPLPENAAFTMICR